MKCDRCGQSLGFLATMAFNPANGNPYCNDCKEHVSNTIEAREKVRAEENAHLESLKLAAAKVIITTTNHVEGCVVTEYLGIESVEYVIGTGLFSEVTTEIQDFFGKRSSAFEKKLRTAKEQAFEALRMVAAEKGANAVVGIDMDYCEFSGNRMALILNGTLVKAKRRKG